MLGSRVGVALLAGATLLPLAVGSLGATTSADDGMTPTPIGSPPNGLQRRDGFEPARITSPVRIASSDDAVKLGLGYIYGGEGVSPGFEVARALLVSFPDGRQGWVVAVGAFGPTTGARLLYRQEDDSVQLLDATGDWVCWQKLDAVPINLGPKGKEFGTLLRTSGRSHRGTGLETRGHFQILAVTAEGFRLLFEGIEHDGADDLEGEEHDRILSFRFSDLDGDGVDEIIAGGKECTSKGDAYKCEPSEYVYRFDGSRFRPMSK